MFSIEVRQIEDESSVASLSDDYGDPRTGKKMMVLSEPNQKEKN